MLLTPSIGILKKSFDFAKKSHYLGDAIDGLFIYIKSYIIAKPTKRVKKIGIRKKTISLNRRDHNDFILIPKVL